MRRRFASLTSRLVITAVTLVAVVSLLVGGATYLAMRSYLTDQLDEKVPPHWPRWRRSRRG